MKPLLLVVMLCIGCSQLEPKAKLVANACDAAIRYNKLELRRYFGTVANRFEQPAPAVPEAVAAITKHSKCSGFAVKGNAVSLEVEALDVPKIFSALLGRVLSDAVLLGLAGKTDDGNELIRRQLLQKLKESNLPKSRQKVTVRVQELGGGWVLRLESKVELFTRVTGGLPTALGVGLP
jgi:hypothetical protein